MNLMIMTLMTLTTKGHKRGGDMINQLRERLAELGKVLNGKQEVFLDMFDTAQLRAYFRCRDSLQALIPALYDLEVAMYQNKILM